MKAPQVKVEEKAQEGSEEEEDCDSEDHEDGEEEAVCAFRWDM